MVNQKQKDQKKKKREKAVKVKVHNRREALRKERREQLIQTNMEREAEKLVNGKLKPIITDPIKLAEREAAQTRINKEKLENNLKILESLEQEYEAEQAVRAEMNEKLESEGYTTMREKMDALHQKALEATGKAGPLAKATEEYAQQNVDVQPIISDKQE